MLQPAVYRPFPTASTPERTVGRLFVEPTTRCTCGARVLEMLYCQTCGDVFLGGFTPDLATQRPLVDALLLADIPDLARLPDQVRVRPDRRELPCLLAATRAGPDRAGRPHVAGRLRCRHLRLPPQRA